MNIKKLRTDTKKLRTENYIKVLFGYYILLLIWLVLFKLEFAIPSRPRSINLIPFYFQIREGSAMGEAIANLLAFVPMGIYPKMLRLSAPKTVLLGASVSLLFELTQLAFGVGVTDITDLMTNTLGTVCGVGVFMLFTKLFKNRAQTCILIPATVLTAFALLYFCFLLVFELIIYGLLMLFFA